MWIEMNSEFRAESEHYRLDFTCEACTYWSEESEACTIFFPSEAHREKSVAALEDGDRLYFC